MRFIVMVHASAQSEAGQMPTEQQLLEMGAFNEQLIKAGVMLAGDGLHPTSKGARITFGERGVRPTVVDGPFTETKELIAGYWIVQMKSKAEAVEWFSRAPLWNGELEIRPLFDTADIEPQIKTDEGRRLLDAEREFRARGKT